MSDDLNLSSAHDEPVVPRVDTLRIPTAVQTSLDQKFVTIAYAIGVIVLSLGSVGLASVLVILSFFHPAEANGFLLLLGSPIAVLALTNTIRIVRIIQAARNKSTTMAEIEALSNEQRNFK